jgi:hypothetical protein
MQGYYTNQQGEVKGYWDLLEKPEDGLFIWHVSNNFPPISPGYVFVKIRATPIWREVDRPG